MSNLTRKDFLKLSSWGIVATLLPIQKINSISSFINSKSPDPGDYQMAVAFAATAKSFFYQKDYAQAESFYLQAIQKAPKAIRFYDGLDNVYGAQRKTLESVLIYKQGLLVSPEKVAFYDRAARSLMRLELGAKSIAAQYKITINSTSLLNDAKTLFLTAIALDSSKLYLNIGLQKIQYKIDTNATQIDYRESVINKQKRKQDKLNSKSRYLNFLNSKSAAEASQIISNVDTKNRAPLYFQKEIDQRAKHILNQKKKYYRILINKDGIDNEYKLELTRELFQLDKSDSTSFKYLKKILYQNGKFFEIVTQYNDFLDLNQNNVYTHLGYMDAVSVAVKRNVLPESEIDACIEKGNTILKNWNPLIEIKTDVVNKMALLLIQKKASNDAKLIINNLFEEINIKEVTSINNTRINSLFNTYAIAAIEEEHYNEANFILLIGTLEADKEMTEKYPIASKIAQGKNNETFKEKQILYYTLYNFYKRINDNKSAEVILNKLAAFDPLDKFVIAKQR